MGWDGSGRKEKAGSKERAVMKVDYVVASGYEWLAIKREKQTRRHEGQRGELCGWNGIMDK